MFNVRVKEFFTEMEWDKENKCMVCHDGINIDEKINNFLEENPTIRVLDIKYCVKFGIKDSEDNETQALLIYEEIPRKPYELSESQYNNEFGIKGE